MAMPSETVPAGIVGSHLQAGIVELERAASEGHYNTMCVRTLGSAAKVLGQDEVADRAARLLRSGRVQKKSIEAARPLRRFSQAQKFRHQTLQLLLVLKKPRHGQRHEGSDRPS